MKLQHLTVIFVVIIVPISFILSMYINTQVDSISMQSEYNKNLMNATYDAVKAFQLNTVNNVYSTVSNSKIRDIEAGINTFYDSLSLSMNINADALRQFTPAVLNTLYDGYYIYSKYSNTRNSNEYEYGLRPYIYYSCRYINDKVDCVINYTLDNAITVYGTIKKGTLQEQYVTRTGFLIDPSNIDNYNTVDVINKLNSGNIDSINYINYKGLNITTESLEETLITIEKDTVTGTVTTTKGTYPYTFYDNKKVYWDGTQYFWYENYEKTPVSQNNAETLEYARRTIGQSRSAINYYAEAYRFSKWIEENFGTLTEANAVDEQGVRIKLESNSTGTDRIFDFNSTNNDPEKSSSTFESHRRAIIRNTIETSLIAALANFNLNSVSGYEYILPKLSDEDWEKIYTEVCITTYMQGLPIGTKYYNNYCVISNNQNKEFISRSSMMFLTKEIVNGIEKYTYHKPNCKHLVDNISNIEIKGVYTNLQLERQTVKISEGNSVYFMPQQANNSTPYLYCYNCVVNTGDVYDMGEFIDGEIRILDMYGEPTGSVINANSLTQVRSRYFTALAREKYDLYASISLISGS